MPRRAGCLPMICRRGGIEKNDIGAIRIFDANTEFEISAAAAESFAAMIKRPDKEDNIRIEALPNGPQGAMPSTRPKPEERDYSSKRKPSYKEKSWKQALAGTTSPAGTKSRLLRANLVRRPGFVRRTGPLTRASRSSTASHAAPPRCATPTSASTRSGTSLLTSPKPSATARHHLQSRHSARNRRRTRTGDDRHGQVRLRARCPPSIFVERAKKTAVSVAYLAASRCNAACTFVRRSSDCCRMA